MSAKISKLTINNFRGIPEEVNLNLTAENSNKPVSLILSGDNGTGKSSIVDALEFALQGKMRKNSNTAFSLSSKLYPRVEVCLSDSTSVVRQMVFNGKRVQLENEDPHEKYSISPFVLRRADILRFVETPDVSKQRIFFEYFKGSIGKTKRIYESQEVASEEIQEKVDQELSKKRKSIKKLAELLKIQSDDIPLDIRLFNLFVSDKLYKGLSPKEVQKRIRQGEQIIPNHIYRQVKEVRDVSLKITQLKKEQKKILQANIRSDTTVLQSILSDAGNRLTKGFQKISQANFVDRIFLVFNDISDMSLTVTVRLKNGKQTSPQHIFSEANLDLLSLLLFVSVLQEAAKHGQEKVLVMDDVFQSVDAGIRVSVVDYILQELSDWQLFLTLHDRLWKNQLREVLRKNGHQFIEREIVRWSFDNGPVIVATKETKELILAAIDRGELVSICAQSGIFLESLCDKLSWVLPISVTRRKEDKYTLGDLWPGVAKALRKTNAKEKVENVEKWIHLRNLVGAHFNEWAQSLSLEEAVAFANSIIQIHDAVYCENCFSWIAPVLEGRSGYMCRCENIRILPV
jgi:AAA15 family ATPase/GTPase